MCKTHPRPETLLKNIGGLAELLSELMGRVDELQKRVEALEELVPPPRVGNPSNPYGLEWAEL